VIELALVSGFAAATVRVATPLALAALGETVSERGGVLNLGIEGAMLAGALGAAVGAVSFGTAGGVLVAVLAGVATSAIVAAVAIGARADQIITGTAVTLGMTGLTGLIARLAFGNAGAGLTVPTMAAMPIPGLSEIPLIGPAFFSQSLLSYAVYLLVPAVAWLLFRTRFGLELRAAGESPSAASAMGVRVSRVRTIGTLIGGAFAGLAGASLVLAQVGTFTEKMTAGRGFIAIAIVVLGRWHPLGAALAALLFGAATALQFTFQASGSAVPYQLFLALPYLLALAVLAVAVGRRKGPAGLGR
jgi:simple sugar transport system permease protein